MKKRAEFFILLIIIYLYDIYDYIVMYNDYVYLRIKILNYILIKLYFH